MAEIRVPTLGESVTEATIGKWFKKAGDAVAVDEPLVELETDKVTVEVPAAAAGTLGEIVAKEGETVGVGALLGSISAGGAAAPTTKPQAVSQASSPDAASTGKQAAAETAKIAGDAGAVEPRTMPPAPAAAKLIAERHDAASDAKVVDQAIKEIARR